MEKIPQGQYDKALGQFRLGVGYILTPLRAYGQGVFVDGAITEICDLAEAFGMRVRGKDKPIKARERMD